MGEKDQALISGKAIKITFAAGEADLLVEILIDCPECGRCQFQIPGHHLRAVSQLLLGWIEEFPDLVGQEAGIHELHRSRFGGRAPQNPEDN